MPVLAIDQGTSATKALVVGPDGAVLASAEIALRPQYRADGGVEQDPKELLDSVLTAGGQAVAKAGRRIEAVSLANQGESVLAWDRATGRALSAVVGWQDRRAEVLCRELVGSRDWVADRTGLVLDPYFSAPKMAWLRRHVTTDGVVTTTDTWLIHHLTGRFVTDAATASRSLLTAVDTVSWDGELLSLFGLEAEPLPDIVGCDEVVGSTGAFGGDVVVGGLVVDQQAALLAQGCLSGGGAKCTFGTGAFLLANIGATASRSRAGLTTSVAWRVRGRTAYCLDGQVYTAASAVRWLQELGLISSGDELDTAAAGDAQGVLCVPALAGLAAPWWRPDATAMFTGMTLSTGRGQLVLAVVQGIAAQVAELVNLVEADSGATLTRLRVDGGLTRSQVLMQTLADLLQIPIDVYPGAHATALGAAAFGRLALDPALGLEWAVPGWSPSTIYEPRWSSDQAHDYRFRWSTAVAAALTWQAPR